MTSGTLDRQDTAIDRYVAEFEALRQNGAPAWWLERRRAALEALVANGFPTMRDEKWRFTNVDPIARTTFAHPPTVAERRVARSEVGEILLGGAPAITVVLVNGRFVPGLSDIGRRPDGVTVQGLVEAVNDGAEAVERHLARYADPADNPFTALNTAMAHDGVLVQVAPGAVVDVPIHLLYVTTPAPEPFVAYPRTLVVVGGGARCTLIETYAGLGSDVTWTNAATEVVVGAGARADHYRVQREGGAAYHTAVSQSYQERDSVYSITVFSFGGLMTRHDINVVLDGEAAEATLNGLSVLTGRQHVDYHTTIDHAKPHCNSWEWVNGIYAERSRGVFNGRIIVRRGAQRTDSKQTNNSLLLSEDARADSQPQLEIYADDVKCTHGATLGPIDERAMFYLRSRGLSQVEARNLLTYGFGAEILGGVSVEKLRQALDGMLRARLAETAQAMSG